jgi:hypothetical protein
VERLLVTAEETAEMLGVGRTKVYELMRLGLSSRSRSTAVGASLPRRCGTTSTDFDGTPWHEHLT